MSLAILAIDQSLTCSGIAIYNGELKLDIIKPKSTGIDRLIEIRFALLNLLKEYTIDLVIMEEYAFSQHGHAFSLGELGGMIKLMSMDFRFPLVIMPIPVHKKFTTGVGNSKKDLMIKEVFKKYDVDTDNDNVADAVSMLKTFQKYMEWFTDSNIVLKESEQKAIKKLDDVVKENSRLTARLKDNLIKKQQPA